ncbi:zinc transporter 7 [Salpingoeca rosetta]|uniref:Zinc transporter 7 n=1 Tax=Salpingoeca rosetta (strain ATCC 50818 / BSB-021) TaxID=946362 RepID=F2UN54_SALR5|nr:zinc transporter 7 [Salpingoeca rosetta]EGD78553.1 zinc transporter 7 [Salpingoeca rosetta]|eukprot:XP_004989502.1 zinc transporter 7 [Salpingoeca rosetta]
MLPLYDDEDKVHGRRSSWWCNCSCSCRQIWSDPESRNIFLFLLINLTFAFVELFYGIVTNSLGLISDSFHMFFDCTALVAGLVASVVAKRPPNERFSFGYQRAEVMGGFVNALFLVFVAFFVLKEALERFFDPPHVHSHRLLPVAIAGLVVNLIGIVAFQHSHSHGHSHGDDHGHSHGHGHSHNHSHSHGHAHGHAHGEDKPSRSFVLDGVLLHIMADTLGSVGVIASSLLIHHFGWMIADPICSIFISVLIFVSTWPLLRDSGAILMQRTPAHLESKLYTCYRRVNHIDGVISYRDPHFWCLSPSYIVGSLSVVIKSEGNDSAVRNEVLRIFNDVGVTKMVVQVERF